MTGVLGRVNTGRSGVNLLKVGVAVIVFLLAGILTFLLFHRQEVPAQQSVSRIIAPNRPLDIEPAKPRPMPAVQEIHNPPRPTEPTVVKPTVTEPAKAQPPSRPAPPEDTFWKEVGKAGVGGFANAKFAQAVEARDEKKLAGNGGGSDFTPSGQCFVAPGTPIWGQLGTRIVTERKGVAVIRTTRDVWNSKMDCLAVKAGAVVTVHYSTEVSRGQHRVEIGQTEIRRPWPQDDSLTIKGVTGDTQGSAGIPARIDYPWASTGLLIAASTAVHLGEAYLSSLNTLFGAVTAQSVSSPLDDAARETLHRVATGSIDNGTEVVVLLEVGFNATDSR